jgi:hypothetical protein
MRGSLRIFFVFSAIGIRFFIAEFSHVEWQKNFQRNRDSFLRAHWLAAR